MASARQANEFTLEVLPQEEAFMSSAIGVIKEQLKILLSKRRLRGTQNILRQGLEGVVTRMGEDKLSRIQAEVKLRDVRGYLQRRGVKMGEIDRLLPAPKGEDTLRDDLLDVANYALIAVMLLDSTWDK